MEKIVEGRRSHQLSEQFPEKSQPQSDPMEDAWSVSYPVHSKRAGLLCACPSVSQGLKAAGGDGERRQEAGTEQNSQAPPAAWPHGQKGFSRLQSTSKMSYPQVQVIKNKDTEKQRNGHPETIKWPTGPKWSTSSVCMLALRHKDKHDGAEQSQRSVIQK